MADTYADATMSTGRAITGAATPFWALGLGLAIAGFAAAIFVGGVEAEAVDPTTAAGGVLGAAIAIIPFIATPILAALVGVWAGTVTRSGGRGALAGAVGTLVGFIVMLILIAIGLAIGAAIGAVPNLQAVSETLGVDVSQVTELQFFATVNGLAYLLVQLIISAVAGAIVGALMPQAYYPEPEERRAARPARV